MNNSISIRLYNVRSLLPKIDNFRTDCMIEKPHIVCLSETWLCPDIKDEEIYVNGYEIIRLDRNRSGGGVAIYIGSNLSYKVIFMDSEIECMCVSVNQSQCSL